jgi:hypothetical protein
VRDENGLIAENESTAKSAGVKPDDTPHRLRTPKLRRAGTGAEGSRGRRGGWRAAVVRYRRSEEPFARGDLMPRDEVTGTVTPARRRASRTSVPERPGIRGARRDGDDPVALAGEEEVQKLKQRRFIVDDQDPARGQLASPHASLVVELWVWECPRSDPKRGSALQRRRKADARPLRRNDHLWMRLSKRLGYERTRG